MSRFNASLTKVRVVSSRSNPIVAEFRSARKERRSGDTVVLLDGEHLVDEARRAGVRVRSAAFLESALKEPSVEALAGKLAASGARITSVTPQVMRALSPVASPGGVVALGELLASGVEQLFKPADAFVVTAVDVQDSGNVGALIRAAAAAGASGVAICGTSADPFSWKALRGSMGSAFHIPVAAGVRVEEVVEVARSRRARVLAAQPRDARNIYDVDLTGSVTILLGAEGSGLASQVAALADERVAIPMAPSVESLNVAVAGAVLAYEIFRQRQAVASSARRDPAQ